MARYLDSLNIGPSALERDEHRRIRFEYASHRARLLDSDDDVQIVAFDEDSFDETLATTADELNLLGALDSETARSPLDVACSCEAAAAPMLSFGDVIFAMRMRELADAEVLERSTGR